MAHVLEFPTDFFSDLILVAFVTLQAYHNCLATEGNLHILKQRCIPAASSSAGLPASKSKQRRRGRFMLHLDWRPCWMILGTHPPINSQAFYNIHSSCKMAWWIFVVCRRGYKNKMQMQSHHPTTTLRWVKSIDLQTWTARCSNHRIAWPLLDP